MILSIDCPDCGDEIRGEFSPAEPREEHYPGHPATFEFMTDCGCMDQLHEEDAAGYRAECLDMAQEEYDDA